MYSMHSAGFSLLLDSGIYTAVMRQLALRSLDGVVLGARVRL